MENPKLLTRERITIMDGKVITIATGFIDRPGVFGISSDATGPLEISVSRNAIIVHHAECQDTETINLLMQALTMSVTLFGSGWQ